MAAANREDRRRAARETRPVEPPPVVDLDEQDEAPVEVEEIELFRITREDPKTKKPEKVTYYMERPRAYLALKLLMKARDEGRDVAIAEMLSELVEPEALEILQDPATGISERQMKVIMDRIMHFATGNLESTLGNS